ncbi:hypothetical protein A5634_00230 [Mycobacterium asiaticum]|uniref:Hemophore-related protein n=1 Tax=Mycobacterium asiaticum TaxID=1790 RepID=A0A1A3NYV7_MYCAS|nr:hemophore-related protein [Mycobacterium asiaticum]OBK26595.1 hypothetical protein A5634_00230 [Mycobacterium asiaticum]
MRLSLIGIGVATGAAALSLSLGAGVASADPLDAAINTTCNYGQVMAALNAVDPAAAAQINANPIAIAKLNQFLSSGPAGRRQIAAQLSAIQGAQQYVHDLEVVADTCNNY